MPAHSSDRRLLQTTSIYLMCNIPFIFKNKFGISDKPDTRRAGVDKSTAGAVYKLLSFRVTHGHAKEVFVHTLYFWANAPFRRGSGRSEWFLNISPICGAAFWYVAPGAPWQLILAVFVTPFFWLDGLLWLLFFVVVDMVVLALVLWWAVEYFAS